MATVERLLANSLSANLFRDVWGLLPKVSSEMVPNHGVFIHQQVLTIPDLSGVWMLEVVYMH